MEHLMGMIAIIAGFVFICLLAWRFEKKPTTFGSARWLTIFEALRKGLLKDAGILVGDWTGLLPVYYDGPHAVTYGAAGTGKGTTAIIPNLLRARYVFVNDPGGENTAVAIRQWRAQNYRIFVINPFRMHADAPWSLPVHSFNPFDFLSPHGDTFAADSKVLAEMLTPRTGRESGSSKYFLDRAQTWLAASIVHIQTTGQLDTQNPGSLYDHVHLDAKGWDALLRAMKTNLALGGLVRAAAIDMERMEAQAPEEFSAVMSTVQQAVEWLAEPNARAAVSRSDTDFDALKEPDRGAVISVVMPLHYKDTHAAIPRLAMQCAVWAMTRGTVSPHKVLLEIDECASLGRVERLPQWLAELRKYKVRWSLHFQNLGQTKALYQAEYQTFLGNGGLKRFVGARDTETMKEISEFCGRTTIEVRTRGPGGVSVSHTGSELCMADATRRERESNQIVIIENLQPIRLKKTRYWDRPEFAGRFHPNPYEGKAKRCSVFTPAKLVWGRLAYVTAWWLTPHPAAAVIIILTLVALIARGCAG
jgi:type IV secretion system protein VirD4